MGVKDIFNRVFTRSRKEEPEERYYMGGLIYNGLSGYNNKQALQSPSFFCGIEKISNAVAQLPINVVKIQDGQLPIKVNHSLAQLLNLQPDRCHTHFSWLKEMVTDVIINGNGYGLIVRDERLNVIEIQHIRPDFVTPMMQPDGSVKYIVTGMQSAVDSSDMLHFYMHIDITHRGISLLNYAEKTLALTKDAELAASTFFKSGGGINGILRANQTTTKEQKKDIKDNWTSTFGNGSERCGVAFLPQGVEYQPISTNPKEGQFLESRQFQTIEISRFLNLSPIQLNDLSNSSWSTLEQTTLSFLQDTIYPWCKMMENEMSYKLFKASERGKFALQFDFTFAKCTDKKTEAEYYTNLVKNGIITLNEARTRLGFKEIDDKQGGNNLFMQMSYSTTENIKDGSLLKNQDNTQKPKKDRIDNNYK